MDEVNKVYLIDDDVNAVMLYTLIVGRAGLQSHFKTFFSAAEAIDELKRTEKYPKYILLDLNMPEMDGFEFLEHFETHIKDRARHTKIIILTSSFKKDDEHRAKKFPVVEDYVIKPIPKGYIENLIRNSA
jgi:CheY-like chemotaxis protein